MKCILLFGLMLIPVITISHAKQTPPFRPVEHEVAFEGCHFKMTDPYRGQITGASYFGTINPKAGHPFETWIQFSCERATPKILSELAGMKKSGKGWAFDTSPKSIGLPQQHTTYYSLLGKDWQAGGVTEDQITGDEDRRTRIFAFCIPHNQLALCGVARHVGYLEHLNEGVLPQVIKLLESIEFIDTPAIKQAAPASPSTAP